METNPERTLVPVQSHGLIDVKVVGNRILGQMVDEVLTLGRGEAEARIPLFSIGDYTWCEPDYRQILLWANQLKMEPLDLLNTLLADKPPKWERRAVLTKFENGRILSLRWDLDKLPISDLIYIEGLKIQEIKMHSETQASLSLMASIFNEPKPPKRSCRKIRLSLPTLLRLDHGGCESETIVLENVPNLTELICHGSSLEKLAPRCLEWDSERNGIDELGRILGGTITLTRERKTPTQRRHHWKQTHYSN